MAKITMEEIMGTVESLSKAVSGVIGHRVEMSFEVTRNGLSVTSDNLFLSSPASLMFKSVRVGSFGNIWICPPEEENSALASFSLHFHYEHQTMGSNGCEAGFAGKRIYLQLSYPMSFGSKNPEWMVVLQ